jgi:hypothetical protein
MAVLHPPNHTIGFLTTGLSTASMTVLNGCSMSTKPLDQNGKATAKNENPKTRQLRPEEPTYERTQQATGCTSEPCVVGCGTMIPASLSELKCLFFASSTPNALRGHKQLLAIFSPFGKIEDLSTYQPLVRFAAEDRNMQHALLCSLAKN